MRLKHDGGSLGGDGDLCGHGPHTGDPFPGDGHHDLSGVFPPGAQASIPCAEPYLCLPANIGHGFGEFLQAQWQGATDVRGRAVRPGPFAECLASLGVSWLGDRARPAPLTAGVVRRRQAQVTHELSGVVQAGQLPAFRDDGDGDGQLHAPQGVQGLDHRGQAPGMPLFVELLCETLQTFGVRVPRPDLFLEDALLGRGGTDDRGEPAPGGRTPGGRTRLADILLPPKRVEPARGSLEILDGICTSPAPSANGFVFDLGNRDGREVTRAHQAGPLAGITTIGFDPVACLLRNQRGGHAPADGPVFRAIAIEPRPTRAGFVDKDQVLGLGLQLAHEWIHVAWPRPHGAQEDALGGGGLGDLGDGDRVFVDLHADVAHARLVHG